MVSLDRQVADLAHERVVRVVQLNVPAFGANLTLIEGALGVLSNAFGLKENEA